MKLEIFCNQHFCDNLNFDEKSKFMVKNLNFNQFWQNIEILVEHRNCRQKLRFSRKNVLKKNITVFVLTSISQIDRL